MVDLNRSYAPVIGLLTNKLDHSVENHNKKTTSIFMDVVRYYLRLLFFIFFVFLLLIFFIFLVVLILFSSHTCLQINHKGNTLKLSF
jgi:hypothetical protein